MQTVARTIVNFGENAKITQAQAKNLLKSLEGCISMKKAQAQTLCVFGAQQLATAHPELRGAIDKLIQSAPADIVETARRLNSK
jgi:hypothetical protein